MGSPTTNKPIDIEALASQMAALVEQNKELQHQNEWLKRQLFGPKSEKRVEPNPYQMSLGEELKAPDDIPDVRPKQKISYERGVGPKVRAEDCVTESGLRFDDTVPVKNIRLPVLGIDKFTEDDYDVIDIKKTYRLAQRPASYVVLCYEQPVIKMKESKEIHTAIMVMNVLDRSVSDVSFLVGMLVDKFLYHLPLYRQHQRLSAAGVTLSRATLTNLTRRSIELLEPIVDAQKDSILQSRVLAMDETPTKAGKSKKSKGKMHHGYYWPIFGDRDEIVFTYSQSRARRVIEAILNHHFTGTLLSDGYSAYASYTAKTDDITHAQCWVHTRRQFFDAQSDEPVLAEEMMHRMAALFAFEAECKEQGLEGEAKREHRLKHSKPVVDGIIERTVELLQEREFLPAAPFTKALGYLHARTIELRVFLENPDVPLDTNHLERALRPIPMGRKNWMFSWTELGAQHVGVIQSLICTCKLQGIDPYIYLTDVLQRISVHPNKDIDQLTPRLWKQHFVNDPMRSDLAFAV